MKRFALFAACLISAGAFGVGVAIAQSRKDCTQKCGGVAGGCAVNTPQAQACFNKCMGTQECPVTKEKTPRDKGKDPASGGSRK